MELKKVSISQFRNSLDKLFREVRTGKKQVIVQRYKEEMFKIVRLSEEQNGIDYPALKVRDCTPQFLDLLDEHDYVFITAWRKRKVACTRDLAV